VEQLFNEEKIDRIELLTGQESSTNDIALFIRSRPRLWRLMDGDESGKIISSILERSRGIFLWAALTVAGLDDLYSIEDIKDALQQVPIPVDLADASARVVQVAAQYAALARESIVVAQRHAYH